MSDPRTASLNDWIDYVNGRVTVADLENARLQWQRYDTEDNRLRYQELRSRFVAQNRQ